MTGNGIAIIHTEITFWISKADDDSTMPKASALEVLIVDDQPSMRGLTKYVL